ncbi:hypothetical protein GF389_00690, partial [Candidatus Dojkabacteria bacterium]|nr:hypothetical protein [Candidatus Dojkabacteria bacterium]
MTFWNKQFSAEDQNTDELDHLKYQCQIVSQLNDKILAVDDIDKILKETLQEIIDKFNLIGAGFLVVEDSKLKVNTLAGKKTRIFVDLIHSPIESLEMDLVKDKNNLVVRCINDNSEEMSRDIETLTRGVIIDKVAIKAGKLMGAECFLVVPIKYAGKSIGAMVFVSAGDNLENQSVALKLLSKSIGITYYNDRLQTQEKNKIRQLQMRNKELNTITELTKNIVSSLKVDEVLQETVDSVPRDLGHLGVIVALFNEDKTKQEVVAITDNKLTRVTKGLLKKKWSDFPILMNDPKYKNMVGYRAVKTGELAVASDFVEAFWPSIPKPLIKAVQKAIHANTVASLPLFSRGEIVGHISFVFEKKMDEDFCKTKKKFMEVYTHIVGIALGNAELFEEKQTIMCQLENNLEELKHIYKRERDIIDIIGHELRTPLTIAKNAIHKIKCDFGDRETKFSRLKRYIDMTYENIHRESRLLETMLSATKIDSEELD